MSNIVTIYRATWVGINADRYPDRPVLSPMALSMRSGCFVEDAYHTTGEGEEYALPAGWSVERMHDDELGIFDANDVYVTIAGFAPGGGVVVYSLAGDQVLQLAQH